MLLAQTGLHSLRCGTHFRRQPALPRIIGDCQQGTLGETQVKVLGTICTNHSKYAVFGKKYLVLLGFLQFVHTTLSPPSTRHYLRSYGDNYGSIISLGDN